MNNKVLVEIYIPAAGEKFDVFIPSDCKMCNVQRLVAGVLSDLTKGKFKASAESFLCDAQTGTVFDINTEVAELNIKNGSHLMLI